MSNKLTFVLRQSSRLVFCLLFVLSFDATAQQRKKAALPRVGVIKDYEATGLTAGCNNYYFEFPRRGQSFEPRYVFLARSEGQDAWMNLNGRDTPLKQIKSARPQTRHAQRYKYRAGGVSINVVIKNIEPKDGAVNEEEYFMFEAFVTLRRGRAARTIKLFGSADC